VSQPFGQLSEIHSCCTQDGIDTIAFFFLNRFRSMRWPCFKWPITGSMAARLFILRHGAFAFPLLRFLSAEAYWIQEN